MEANVCGKEWIPLEGSMYWTTWTTIDQSIFYLRRTKIPWPVTKRRLVQPRKYRKIELRPTPDEDAKTITSTSSKSYSDEDAKTVISKSSKSYSDEDAKTVISKSSNSDEDAETLTGKSMSLCEAQSISLLEECSSDDDAYSEKSEFSWTPRGAIVYLQKTKIPVPVISGRLVMPRRYRMTFPWDDNWAYAL